MWEYISFLGEPLLWFGISVALMLAYGIPRLTVWRGGKGGPRRRLFRKLLIIFIISLYLTLGVLQAVKLVAYSPRPCTLCPAEGCNPYCLQDSTFPSGHSATIFVFFSTLFIAFRKRWTLPLFIIPCLVAVSRVFLGVHYFYDVVAGSLVGLIIPFMVERAISHMRAERARKGLL